MVFSCEEVVCVWLWYYGEEGGRRRDGCVVLYCCCVAARARARGQLGGSRAARHDANEREREGAQKAKQLLRGRQWPGRDELGLVRSTVPFFVCVRVACVWLLGNQVSPQIAAGRLRPQIRRRRRIVMMIIMSCHDAGARAGRENGKKTRNCVVCWVGGEAAAVSEARRAAAGGERKRSAQQRRCCCSCCCSACAAAR